MTDLCYRRFRHLFPFLSYLHFDDTTIAIPTTSVSSKRPRLHILLHPVSCPLSSVLRLPRVNDVSPVRSILRQSQEFHALNSELSSPIFNDPHVRCLLVVILALYITRGSFGRYLLYPAAISGRSRSSCTRLYTLAVYHVHALLFIYKGPNPSCSLFDMHE